MQYREGPSALSSKGSTFFTAVIFTYGRLTLSVQLTGPGTSILQNVRAAQAVYHRLAS
jgi:hypothetical protein